MSNGNAKVTISFQGVFSDLEKSLDTIDKKMQNLQVSKSAGKELAELKNIVAGLKEQTDKLSNEKINSGNFVKYTREVNGQIGEIVRSTETLRDVIKNVIEKSELKFPKTKSGIAQIGELESALDSITITANTTKKAINEIAIGNFDALKRMASQIEKTQEYIDKINDFEINPTTKNKTEAKNSVLKLYEEYREAIKKVPKHPIAALKSDDLTVKESAIKSVTNYLSILSKLNSELYNIDETFSQSDAKNNAFWNNSNKNVKSLVDIFAEIGQQVENIKKIGFDKFIPKLNNDLKEQVNQQFKDMTQIDFSNNALKVPIVISNTDTLLNTIYKLIETLNTKLKNNPIEIQLNLTSQWGTRKYKEALNELNEKISNISGSKKAKQQLEDLQESITKFANTYGDVIKVRIDESYYDALERARDALVEMRQAAGKAIKIDVSGFNITKEVVDNFKEQFTKLAGGIDLAVRSVKIADDARFDSSIEELLENTLNDAINNVEKNMLLNKAVQLPMANNIALQAMSGLKEYAEPNFDKDYMNNLEKMATNSIKLSEAIQEIAKSLSTVNTYFSDLSGEAISPLDKLIEKLSEIALQIQNIGKSLTGINPVSELSTIQEKVNALINDVNNGLKLGTKDAKQRIRDIIVSYSSLVKILGEEQAENIFGKLNLTSKDNGTKKVLKSLNNNWKNREEWSQQQNSNTAIVSLDNQFSQLTGVVQNIYSYLISSNYRLNDIYKHDDYIRDGGVNGTTSENRAYENIYSYLKDSKSEDELIINTLRGLKNGFDTINGEKREISVAVPLNGQIDKDRIIIGGTDKTGFIRDEYSEINLHTHASDKITDKLFGSIGDIKEWFKILREEAENTNINTKNGHVLQHAVVAFEDEAIKYDFSKLNVNGDPNKFKKDIGEIEERMISIAEATAKMFGIDIDSEGYFQVGNVNPHYANMAYDYIKTLQKEELSKHNIGMETYSLDGNNLKISTDERILDIDSLNKQNVEEIKQLANLIDERKELQRKAQELNEILKNDNLTEDYVTELTLRTSELDSEIKKIDNLVNAYKNYAFVDNKKSTYENKSKIGYLHAPERAKSSSGSNNPPDDNNPSQHTVAEAKEMADALKGNKFLTKEQAEDLEKINKGLERLKNPGTPKLEGYVKQLEEITEAAQKAEEATKNFRDPEHIGETIANAQNFFRQYEGQFGTFIEDSMKNNKGSFQALFQDEKGQFTTLGTTTKNGIDFEPASIKEIGFKKFAQRYVKEVEAEIEQSRLLLEQEASNIDDVDLPEIVRQRLAESLEDGEKALKEIYLQYRRGKKGEDFKAYKFKYDNGMTEIFGYNGDLLQRNSQPVAESDKALSNIKELKKISEEYWSLQGKKANTGLTNEESQRLSMLKDKWEELNSQINKSIQELEEWGVEAKTIRDAQNNLNNNGFEDYIFENTQKAYEKIQNRTNALNDSGKGFTPEYQAELLKAKENIEEINRLMAEHSGVAWEKDEEGLKKILGLLNQVQETTSDLNLKSNTLVPTGEVDKLIGKLKSTNFEKLQLPFNQKKQMTDMINYLEEIRAGGTEAAEALEKAFGIKIDAKDLSKIDANTYKKIAESVTGMVAATKGVDEGFFSRFGARLKSVNMQFVTMMFSFYDWIRYARQALSVVQQFDKALTTISFTMNTTTKQLNGLAQQSIDMAKELGTTTDQVLNVAQIYANMQSTPEEIMERAKPTVMLSTASGLDTSTVSDYLQAVENEFEMSASDAEHIADVYESISANIAMDFGKGIGVIAEGTQVSGQLAHEAGMSFEQFAAIIAKTAETTRQSGSVIGNAWKTIISRLTKSGSMSEEVDPETLSKSAESLGAIGIQIYDNMGNFRDLDTILTELSSKWGSLSDAQQANIAYNVAGK